MSDLHAATEAWLIRMSDGTRFIHGHNAIGDYRAIDPDATVTELVPRAALSAPAGWQPIETAPKDGTSFLGYWPTIMEGCGYCACKWFKNGWWEPNEDYPKCPPTHWMPLPVAPSAKETQT